MNIYVERPYLKVIKAIHDTPTGNLILNQEKLDAFPLKSRKQTRVPNITIQSGKRKK